MGEYNKSLTSKEEKPEFTPEDFLQKASYYYQQALLIFYYIIPDDKEQELEINEIKKSCHLNQSLCLMKQKKFDECHLELDQVLKIDKLNVKALYRKAQVYEL